MRIRRRKLVFALSSLAAAAVGFVVSEEAKAKAKEPKYKLLHQEGIFEIRSYPSVIVAQIRMEKQRQEALTEGFRILAAYIFGRNTHQETQENAGSAKQPPEKIAMTTPVTAQLEGRRWLVSFIMPEGYSLNTLPKPKDDRIEIKELPAQNYACIRFSGTAGERHFQKKRDELLKFMGNNNMLASGQAIEAYYNPPFILPLLKRNEVLIPINTSPA
jgi:hypothetical protein